MEMLQKLANVLNEVGFSANLEGEVENLGGGVVTDNRHVSVFSPDTEFWWSVWYYDYSFEVHLNNEEIYSEYYCDGIFGVVYNLVKDMEANQ